MIKQEKKLTWTAAELTRNFPPRWQDDHKTLLSNHVGFKASSGDVTFFQYALCGDPKRSNKITELEIRPDVFGYETYEGHWHLNFANRDAFVAYAGSLLAQDELQCAEHPALGSVRECLLDTKEASLFTVTGQRPTPVLVAGVERRCAIRTAPSAEIPAGLYGNQFREVDVDCMLSAVDVLDPPTRSNIVAIEAPVGFSGEYTACQIEFILDTAYCGFAAAKHASIDLFPDVPTIVHTGFWGCGAYGGNRELMIGLQIAAANFAGLDCLIIHTVDEAGLRG